MSFPQMAVACNSFNFLCNTLFIDYAFSLNLVNYILLFIIKLKFSTFLVVRFLFWNIKSMSSLSLISIFHQRYTNKKPDRFQKPVGFQILK